MLGEIRWNYPMNGKVYINRKMTNCLINLIMPGSKYQKIIVFLLKNSFINLIIRRFF